MRSGLLSHYKRDLLMTQKLLFIFSILLLVGCTTSKWTVVDEFAVDDSEKPRLVSEEERLLIDDYPTVENPVLRLAPYKIVENEYSQRILVERTVQQYRPRWGFALLALSGSAFAITAANTDLILSNPTNIQRVGLSLAGGLLGVLAFTNLKEVGDPILTNEKQYLRSTGRTTRIDTVRSISTETTHETATIEVLYQEKSIFNQQNIPFSNNFIDLNVGSLADRLHGEFNSEAEITINSVFKRVENQYRIPLNSFLKPYFVVRDAVAQVRSNPSISSGNILVELGEDSELLKLEDYSSDWFKVEYALQEVFISKGSGIVEWRSLSDAHSALLVELTEIPFGDIDVENSLPVLKSRNEADRAIIFTNIEENQIGSRQLLNRSHQLFERYMRTSLQMGRDQIIKVNVPDSTPWKEKISQCGNMEEGTLSVYLTGFAQVDDSDTNTDLIMAHVDTDGKSTSVSMTELFRSFADCNPEKMFIFADLEYMDSVMDLLQPTRPRNNARGVQQAISSRLLDDFPNAVIIFGNSTNQQSSAYMGSLDNHKQHSIFTYYLADALKKRKTTMSDLINHLENNVDYTSRRLHDRPQEIRAFGNFSLNIAR